MEGRRRESSENQDEDETGDEPIDGWTQTNSKHEQIQWVKHESYGKITKTMDRGVDGEQGEKNEKGRHRWQSPSERSTRYSYGDSRARTLSRHNAHRIVLHSMCAIAAMEAL